ncbi:hypothetical protein V1477_004223, partial [Vespula maculifrons]
WCSGGGGGSSSGGGGGGDGSSSSSSKVVVVVVAVAAVVVSSSSSSSSSTSSSVERGLARVTGPRKEAWPSRSAFLLAFLLQDDNYEDVDYYDDNDDDDDDNADDDDEDDDDDNCDDGPHKSKRFNMGVLVIFLTLKQLPHEWIYEWNLFAILIRYVLTLDRLLTLKRICSKIQS